MVGVLLQKNVKRLVEVLTSSDKRSKIVLMLSEGPMSLAELTTKLGSCSSNVIPQIRKLELEGLVESRERAYTLTGFGRLVCELYSGFLCGIDCVPGCIARVC